MKNLVETKWLITSILGLSLSLLAAPSCTELGEAYDCAYVCDRYSECYDNEYDVAECTTSCEDDADLDESYAQQVNDCQDCIDSRSCDENFSCIDECISIVP